MRVRRREDCIGLLLWAGVTGAGVMLLVGLVGFFVHGSQEGTDLLRRGPAPSPLLLLRGLAHGDPLAFLQLGILLLILTPVLRVAMTVWLFAAEGDGVFVGIAAVVLVVLLLGLGGIGG